MIKWKLHSDVFFRHRGGYSLKELWFNLVLLKFEHRCGLSKSTGSAGPGENTCEMDLNDDDTFRDVCEDSYNTGCVIENKICKGNDGCSFWNNKKRGYSIRGCDESYFSSSVCGESENHSQIEHFGIITGTNDSDFTQIDSDTEGGSTQIESTTEENSTQIESDTEEDSTPSFAHLWVLCEECYTLNYKRFLKERLYICEGCESHLIMNSSERIELLIDPNTWDPMNEKIDSIDPIEWDSEEAEAKLESEEDRLKRAIEEALIELDSKEDPINQDLKLKLKQALIEMQLDCESILSQRASKEPPIELHSEKAPIQWDLKQALIEWNSEKDPEKRNLRGLIIRLNVDFNNFFSQSKSASQEPPIELYSEGVPAEFYSELYSDRGPIEWDSGGVPIELDFEDDPYKDRIDSYQKKTGLTEAIQTGIGQINGIPVAMGVMEFEFMGGSMGSVVGEKITRLIEYATNKSLPLIIVCASGGARMQEGSLSLMQMAKISSALYHFQTNQKLFYVSILTSPTTGGVTASFGMLGDIIVAEPDAYIAFAGKRVIEQTLNKEVPEGSQETENLFDKGLFDLVVPRNTLKSVLNELFQAHGFFRLNQNSIE